MLPSATQQELCLTPAHGGCERFLHRRNQRAAALAQDQIEVGRLESARFGPFVSPVLVAVDARPPAGDHGRRSASGRRRVPALIIGAGVILVGVVALAAIFGGGRSPGLAVLSPSPSPQLTGPVAGQATVAPSTVTPPTVAPLASDTASFVPASTPALTPATTQAPSLRPAATATAAPSASAASPSPATTTPEPVASPGPEPTATVRPTPAVPIARRYTVKQGDTLKSIANKFGLRPRDLRAVNNIGKEVVVGQRLRIPARSVSPP